MIKLKFEFDFVLSFQVLSTYKSYECMYIKLWECARLCRTHSYIHNSKINTIKTLSNVTRMGIIKLGSVQSVTVNSTNPLNSTIYSGHTPLTSHVKTNPKFDPANWKENLCVILVELTGANFMCTCVYVQ